MMKRKSEGEGTVNLDVKSFSDITLVRIIEELRDSNHPELLKKAQKELVERVKKKGVDNKQIARILVTNVYGAAKKKLIAQEWADALGITKDEFLKLIEMK